MKTIYWPIDSKHIVKCEVLFETENSLFIKTENLTETVFHKYNRNKEWFENLDTAEIHAAKLKEIEKLKAELAELEPQA